MEDLALYFDASLGLAESVSVGGVNTRAIFEDNTQIELGEVLIAAPTALVVAAQVPAVAEGQPVVRGAITYRIRQVLPEATDASLVRLVLAKEAA